MMFASIIVGKSLITATYGAVYLIMLTHTNRQDERLKRQLKHHRARIRYKKYMR